MENETQQNIPPIQPLSQTPSIVSPSTNWSKILLFTVLGLVVVAGSVFAGIQIGKNQTSNQQPIVTQPTALPTQIAINPSVAPTTIPTTNPTVNWKTYTSSNFGVSFKYPVDLFVYEGNPQTDAQFWSNKPDGGAPMELGLDGVWMNLSVTKLDDAGFNYWSNKISSDKPGPKNVTTSEVLQILNTDGIRGVVYYDLPKPNSEAAYAYDAMWMKDKTLYKLFLATFNDANLVQHKNAFDQILSTFKFTN